MGEDPRIVTAAVLIEDSRLLLARRAPHDRLPGYWELPGGKLEPGETPQECLARELREELAMTAEIGEMVAETLHKYAHGCFRLIALKTVRLSEFELLVHDRVAWVARDEIGEYRLAPADVALVDNLIASGRWA
ncbi:MAG TPA: (deoxy)nucleoside triphosphate pyrophosphohydrolase [Coriobacteriia bacterium]|jgi:8-oxo-dGTP diphosphatase